MYEINENKKVVSIMPGLDNTNNLKAYPLDNTLVVGEVGSGVEQLVQEIIMHAVTFNSPECLQVEWYKDPFSKMCNPFLNPSRTIPHFSNQFYEYDCYDEMFAYLGSIVHKIYECVMSPRTSDEWDKFKHHLFVVELKDDMFTGVNTIKVMHRRCILSVLAKLCKRNKKFSVLYYTQCSNIITEELLKQFDLRLVTRLADDSISNRIMGCNLASLEKSKSGVVWVSDENNPYEKVRLRVKFYPDTLINKYCKVYSNNVSQQNKDLFESYDEIAGDCKKESLISCILRYHTPENNKYINMEYEELVEVFSVYLNNHI